jgi:hypothetical protein
MTKGKRGMEKLFDLPPLALVTLGATLAVIFAARYLGLMTGERSGPVNSPAAAQVAAVIVDPTALNRATEAVKDLTSEVQDLNRGLRELVLELARRR